MKAPVTLLGVALFLWGAAGRPLPAQQQAVRSGGSLPVTVTTRVSDGRRHVLAKLNAVPSGESADSGSSRTVQIEDGSGRVELVLGPGKTWVIEASAPGYWSPAAILPPGSSRRLEITLWPAAPARGVLRPPEGAQAPDRVSLRLRLVPGAAGVGQPREPASVDCRLDKQRLADCSVPLGRWNVRVEAPGFAPHFLWDRRIEAAHGLDLGKLALKLGGSVSGRVITAEGPADRRQASVVIQPLTDRGPSSEEETRSLEQRGSKAEINEWGYFRFEGVAPGSYELRASQPDFSEAVRSPVVVKRGTATDLEDPLVLSRPLRLSVTIEPPDGPYQKPWHLRVHRSAGSETMDQVADGTTDTTGFWRSPPLAAGAYRLEVVDGDGNRAAWRKIDLEPDSQDVAVEIPLIWVEGKVVLGSEPLSAHLWFGGIGGTESVEADSDDSGEFLAILPHEGEWTVDVQADSPPVTSRGLSVDVEPVGGLRTADVRIEVPDTSISGDVVNEVGLSVAGAEVRISSFGTWQGAFKVPTDPEGRFEIRGLSPGPYGVEAESADQTSDSVLTSVSDHFSPTVHLTLQADRILAGNVVADSGPVASARVIAYPVDSAGRPATIGLPEGRTDVRGRFEVKIPRSAALVRLLVLAPGYDLALTRATRGASLVVPLSPVGGTLHLASAPKAEGAVGLLLVQGEPIDLPRLELWARMNGVTGWHNGVLSVPAMPSGQYAYCRLSLQEALLVVGGAAAPTPAACTEGYLPAGGDLSLGS